jgi:hypothetical protein
MPFMKRFRMATDGEWTRRGALAGAAASLAACSNPPVPAWTAASGGPHPLWPMNGPPVLRGAVIAQRRRRSEVDGDTFGGGEAVLPRYQRRDFEALAAAGGNLVVMSFPELWTVGPPWKRDTRTADILGRQLDDAQAAGLYVVLALRSGPGRSDFVFHRDAVDQWFPARLIEDSIWRDGDAQTAWNDMCVDAAKLVKDRSEIAGLNIMVEPDPNVGGLNREGRRLSAWTPGVYSAQVAEVSDWRRMAAQVASRVRAAAPDLPVLISPPAFARTDFLPVMGAPPVTGVVWCVHDYEPRDYTHHPEGSAGLIAFSEGGDHAFGQRVDSVATGEAPIFLGEFGASRWAMDVDAYYAARIAACEARGMGWAAFRWPTQDKGYEAADSVFNVLQGARGDPPAVDALKVGWAKNSRRPEKVRLRGRS